MPDSSYDCIVIGSGPGGYVAAIRAAQLGMKTAVVERDVVGGRCLNYACIPAKAVLRVADVLAEIDDADDFGISVPERSVDFDKVMERRQKVIKTLTGGVAGLFKKNKIEYIEGQGSVTDDGNVKVGGNFDGTEIEAKTRHPRHRLGAQAAARHRVRRPHHRHRGGVGARDAAGDDGRGRRRRVGRRDRLRLRPPRDEGDAVRGARPRGPRRGRRDLEGRRARARQAEHDDLHGHQGRGRQDRRRQGVVLLRRRVRRGRLVRDRRRPRARRRGARPRGGRRQARRARDDRRRRRAADVGQGRLRDRRPRARPGARPQGLRRGHHRRRGRRRDGDAPDRVHRHPARHVLHAQRRLVRAHRGAGEGAGHRRRRRQGQLRRRRRRHRLRRPRRHDQDHRRQEVRRADRRPHRRRPRDRADPGARKRPRARGRLPRGRRASSTVTPRCPRPSWRPLARPTAG